MELEQAIKLLKKHNLWRRGASIPMMDTKEIGMAIDVITNNLSTKIEEKHRKLTAFREKTWREVKQLEQEYKRNAAQIQEITDRQSDVSARVQILLAKIYKKGDKYDNSCYESKVEEGVEELNAKDSKPFDALDTFVFRLSKLGISLEMVMNYPWVYLKSVNGNTVSERFKSEYGFTVAFMPIRPGDALRFTNIKEIFKVIRKYSFYNARIFGGKAL